RTPLNAVDSSKGPPQVTGVSCQSHSVTQLVADERLCPAGEHRDQHFVAIYARWHRTVLLVYHLKDHIVFIDIETRVIACLRCKPATGFGCPIAVERRMTPCLLDAPPSFLGEHFRTGDDHV